MSHWIRRSLFVPLARLLWSVLPTVAERSVPLPSYALLDPRLRRVPQSRDLCRLYSEASRHKVNCFQPLLAYANYKFQIVCVGRPTLVPLQCHCMAGLSTQLQVQRPRKRPSIPVRPLCGRYLLTRRLTRGSRAWDFKFHSRRICSS